MIDELPEAELLQAVTPERVGEKLGYSSSSVRYQFARLFSEGDDGAGSTAAAGRGQKWSFDRARLLELLVEEIEERVIETTLVVRDAYLRALDRAAAVGHLGPLVDAVIGDLDAYSPGATDDSTNLSERANLLAVTACDRSSGIGRRLLRLRERELELYEPLYARGLILTGRRLQPGVTTLQIADAVAQLVEGATLVRRYRPSSEADDRTTARGMLAVFVGMTEPEVLREEAPLAALRCGPG